MSPKNKKIKLTSCFTDKCRALAKSLCNTAAVRQNHGFVLLQRTSNIGLHAFENIAFDKCARATMETKSVH